MPFGLADWRGILQSVSKRDYLRYVCYLAEMGVTETKKNKTHAQIPTMGSVFIIDMEGLSTKQMTYKPCEILFQIIIKIKIFILFFNVK